MLPPTSKSIIYVFRSSLGGQVGVVGERGGFWSQVQLPIQILSLLSLLYTDLPSAVYLADAIVTGVV